MSKSASMRADAARNRETLIQIAREQFSEGNHSITMEQIAERAKVGIGTLYRHFPTRETLVEAVYRTELDKLANESERLLESHSGAEALRLWMDRYAQFVTTKRAMYEALRALLQTNSGARFETRARISAVVEHFLAAGAADRTLRGDMEADDLTVALAAVVLGTRDSADPNQLGRLLDLLMDGLCPSRRGAFVKEGPTSARGSNLLKEA